MAHIFLIGLLLLGSGCGTIRVIDHSQSAGTKKGYLEIYQVRTEESGAIFSKLPLYVDGILVDRQSGNAWQALSQRTRVTLEPGLHMVAAKLGADVPGKESAGGVARLKTEVPTGKVRLIKISCSRIWNGDHSLATNSLQMTEGPILPYRTVLGLRRRQDALTGEAFMAQDMGLSEEALGILAVLKYFVRPGFYVTSVSVPYRKLVAVCASCDVNMFSEKVLGVVDATAMGTASDGILFTSQGVHAKNSVLISDPPFHKYWPYSEFHKLPISEFDRTSLSIGGFRFNTSDVEMGNATLSRILRSVQFQVKKTPVLSQ